MNIKYEITIHWSEEDESYISEIQELEGCIADGKTPEEALKMLEEVYAIWMESAKKYKATIPKPKLFYLGEPGKLLNSILPLCYY